MTDISPVTFSVTSITLDLSSRLQYADGWRLVPMRIDAEPNITKSWYDLVQVLTIQLTSPDGLLEPSDLDNPIFVKEVDSLLGEGRLDPTQGVIINGKAPIWLYAHLVHQLHPVAWVATNDPRLGGAVVVATHNRQVKIGQVIPF